VLIHPSSIIPPSILLFIRCPPPPSPLCPYTTLFRSCRPPAASWCSPSRRASRPSASASARSSWPWPPGAGSSRVPKAGTPVSTRSEEHTSELQSHLNLVCRLLLEKKNTKQLNTSNHQ